MSLLSECYCLNVLFQVVFCATIFFRGAKVFINCKVEAVL